MQLSERDLEGKYWAADYRRWHASGLVEESDGREVAGKLMSGNGEQEYSAAAELWMRTRCEELEGLRFDFHPRLQDKTPDFVFWDVSGALVVADVAVLHSGPMWGVEAEQQEFQDMRRRIHRVETEHFAVKVLSIEGNRSVKGPGGGSVAVRRVVHEVRERVKELEARYGGDPSWLGWEPQWLKGMRSVTRRVCFPELDIDLTLEVAFYLKGDETEEFLSFRGLEDTGKIGVGSGFTDDAGQRIDDVVRGKSSYLSGLTSGEGESEGLAYMVIVFDPDSSVEPMDVESALHGSSMEYDVGSGPLRDDFRQWARRGSRGVAVSYGEGVFTSRRKRLLGVVKCTGDFRVAGACELSMWVNPYASYFSVPQPLFRLKTYSLNRQVECTPSG